MNLASCLMLSVTDSATMNLAHHLMLSIMGSSTVNWAPYSKLDSLWVRHQEWISAWVRSVSCKIQHQSYSVESNMGHGSSTPLLPGLLVIPLRSPWRGCCGSKIVFAFYILGLNLQSEAERTGTQILRVECRVGWGGKSWEMFSSPRPVLFKYFDKSVSIWTLLNQSHPPEWITIGSFAFCLWVIDTFKHVWSVPFSPRESIMKNCGCLTRVVPWLLQHQCCAALPPDSVSVCSSLLSSQHLALRCTTDSR